MRGQFKRWARAYYGQASPQPDSKSEGIMPVAGQESKQILWSNFSWAWLWVRGSSVSVAWRVHKQIIQVQTSSEFDSKGEGVIPVAGHVHKH